MQPIIRRDQITIPPNRQRSALDRTTVADLCKSIRERGLLNPPSFSQISENLYRLVAGQTRLAAIDQLAAQGEVFYCGGVSVSPGEVPFVLFHSDDKLERFEAELEENIIRKDLSWQDRSKALATLHRLRSEANPTQTQKDTATEIAERNSDSSPANVERLRQEVRRATVLEKFLDDPAVAGARNEAEAYQIALKTENEKYEAELLRRRKRSVEGSLRCTIRQGDATELMQAMDAAQFDLILSDPPYGLDAGSAGYRARTVHHHNYNDSPDNARRILQSILTDGWQLTKPKANLFLFTDIMHFEWLQAAAARMGWTPWRHPIIWQKSTAEGLVPWGRNGFVHTFDIIFYATKGRRGTNQTNVDILNYSRVARNERVYAAEKPIPLLSRLIELTTLPGDSVFDPCAGSGSTLLAAKELKRHSFGIEIDPQVCDLATVRIEKGDSHVDWSILDGAEPAADAAGSSTVPDTSQLPLPFIPDSEAGEASGEYSPLGEAEHS
jgi:DNA modification methylase/ParB-like chromosome segregation protein Spo0J